MLTVNFPSVPKTVLLLQTSFANKANQVSSKGLIGKTHSFHTLPEDVLPLYQACFDSWLDMANAADCIKNKPTTNVVNTALRNAFHAGHEAYLALGHQLGKTLNFDKNKIDKELEDLEAARNVLQQTQTLALKLLSQDAQKTQMKKQDNAQIMTSPTHKEEIGKNMLTSFTLSKDKQDDEKLFQALEKFVLKRLENEGRSKERAEISAFAAKSKQQINDLIHERDTNPNARDVNVMVLSKMLETLEAGYGRLLVKLKQTEKDAQKNGVKVTV